MARLKKEQRPERISGGYSPIPWVVLDSDSFKGATDKAKALLFALMRQHNGQNNGHLHLAKKWLYGQGWTCDTNNRKARKELIERALIVHTKQGGLNMGPDLFALAWYDITNYGGLDITPRDYNKGLYTLCKLPPTQRRKQPIRKKSQPSHDASASTATEQVDESPCTTTERIAPDIKQSTGTVTENNVFIPLSQLKTVKRIVGVKGKSGIEKVLH
jgi:hypothetical protein